jgi:hypothetical protein
MREFVKVSSFFADAMLLREILGRMKGLARVR